MTTTPFTVRRVETRDELQAAYRLRYQVYCQEYGYLDPQRYADGLESDEWDAHSVHFIVLTPDERMIATSRLIGDSERGLLIEQYVPLPPATRGARFEVSRLTMSLEYRGHGNAIIHSLCKAMFDYSRSIDIHTWFSTMFLGTWKLLLRFGIYFTLIGDPAFWPKGSSHIVAPGLFDLRNADIYLRHTHPDLCDFYYEGTDTNRGSARAAEVVAQSLRDRALLNDFKSSFRVPLPTPRVASFSTPAPTRISA
ncbi:MAG TPA: GNAT family N-acyltransferase [Armatimonadota bacterium]|jgi:N-acyl-L-homoserine lactone synthetase